MNCMMRRMKALRIEGTAVVLGVRGVPFEVNKEPGCSVRILWDNKDVVDALCGESIAEKAVEVEGSMEKVRVVMNIGARNDRTGRAVLRAFLNEVEIGV